MPDTKSTAAETEIVPFRAQDGEAFYVLNRAWLDAHGIYEPADEEQLADPAAVIIAPGGALFIARCGGDVVGTVAIVPHGADEMELAKLTVVESARGGGLGRRLVERCLDFARTVGARRVVLMSNSRLAPAVRLYEAMGFEHRPLPSGVKYATADVYMVLELA
ncbi:MAG: family N-acetyltransferase [Gemmatimonadetes bacterium]|nr:family N-acetyltransferase [Gemmatimonadota bacterium]